LARIFDAKSLTCQRFQVPRWIGELRSPRVQLSRLIEPLPARKGGPLEDRASVRLGARPAFPARRRLWEVRLRDLPAPGPPLEAKKSCAQA